MPDPPSNPSPPAGRPGSQASPLVIFLSAVTDEFHKTDPNRPQAFKSYREILTEGFRRSGLAFQIIVQEELSQGPGDLLHTLDQEVARAGLIIHLVGDLAGCEAGAAETRRLRQRHPSFLADEPELLRELGDFSGITYTQWEMYLAYQYDLDKLLYYAEESAPRSPSFSRQPAQEQSQEVHRRRLRAAGKLPEFFAEQRDLALKAVTAVFRHILFPGPADTVPTPQAMAAAREQKPAIVADIAAAIKKPDPVAVPVQDEAGVAAYLAAVDRAAASRGLDRRSTLQLVDEHEAEQEAAVEAAPTAANLYDLAFTKLALGRYREAMRLARRAADAALEQLRANPAAPDQPRQDAINAFLLLNDAAQAAVDAPAGIAALEEGGALIDRTKDPLLWASFHTPLARHYLDQYNITRAEALVNDIVDIHEEHLPGNDPQLAGTLLIWSHLLWEKADYNGMTGVAARAERIFQGQAPPDLVNAAAAMNNRGIALHQLGNHGEAEPLFRRALATTEHHLGPDHPNVASSLDNLAQLLQDTNRLAEAEPLMRRALATDERSFGPDHPTVAIRLNNLAQLLKDTNRLAESEPLMRRALAIDERRFGPDHPNVASILHNLAQLLQDTNRLAESEPLMRRALAIDERSFGPDHPNVAIRLSGLALWLHETNRLAEAEPLLRRAVEILLKFTPDTGHEHPRLRTALGNYFGLLRQSGLSEADAWTKLNAVGAPFGMSFGPNA